MGSGKGWHKKFISNIVSAFLVMSCLEKDIMRYLIRKEEMRKTNDNMVRKYHIVDRCELESTLRFTDNRAHWRFVIHNAVNTQTEDHWKHFS